MTVYMNPANIHTLTIHCSASPAGRGDSAEDVERWDIERFRQPSYHHVLEEGGRVKRSLRDNQRGAHVGGHNTGNIGICYIGGIDAAGKPKDTRTAAQRQAMLRLVREYRRDYPGIRVMGHRDWGVPKACPSFDVAAWLLSEGIDE